MQAIDIDGVVMCSCILLTNQEGNQSVTTIEGLFEKSSHPQQETVAGLFGQAKTPRNVPADMKRKVPKNILRK